jgi:hypothetical protein
MTRNITTAINGLLKTAAMLDSNSLYVEADILHGVLKRMANDDEFMFGGEKDRIFDDYDGVGYPENEPRPSFKELERIDLERELFELIMKKETSPEGLTQEEREHQLQIIHFLKGNSWDSYNPSPDSQRLKAILEDKSGYITEEIDNISYDNADY